MKEASGETSMTLITIVAVAAIGGLIYLLYPTIANTIKSKWGDAASGANACPNGVNEKTGRCK